MKKKDSSDFKQKVDIDSTSILYNNKGAELWAPIYQERIPEAIALFDTALQIDNRNISAHANRLNLLLMVDSLRAREAYDKMENLYPEVKFSSFFLGMMSEYYNRSEKANYYFHRALNFSLNEMGKNPDSYTEMIILNDLGSIYTMLNLQFKADSVYQIIDDNFNDEIDYSFYSGEFRFNSKEELMKDFYESASKGEL